MFLDEALQRGLVLYRFALHYSYKKKILKKLFNVYCYSVSLGQRKTDRSRYHVSLKKNITEWRMYEQLYTDI